MRKGKGGGGMKPILHLNLTRKWFDMIKSGEKKEEYRAMSPYWKRVFCSAFYSIKIKKKEYQANEITICFSNGYSKAREQMFIDCKELDIGEGKKEWGAEEGVNYFILKL